ncbi:MAG: hypothetical protein DHS20C14_05360 [Phycisphaeraceae bacterium]|nr:MAG: hypothetical protein DHS20C14_05360 [Phycisphaeraceae bacterium]
MRKIWTIVSVVAFLNLMAILAGIGWLVQTGRLDRERLVEIRDVLFGGAEDDGAITETSAGGEGGSDTGDGEVRSAEDRLGERLARSEADEERLRRMRREVADLQAAVRRERRLLDGQRTEFESERTTFWTQRQTIADVEGGDQFRRALVVFETMKAGEAKETLAALLADGKRVEVVAYLNAMEDRVRSKIMAEFVKDQDAGLAAELLEDIRQRGIGDLPPGDPGT